MTATLPCSELMLETTCAGCRVSKEDSPPSGTISLLQPSEAVGTLPLFDLATYPVKLDEPAVDTVLSVFGRVLALREPFSVRIDVRQLRLPSLPASRSLVNYIADWMCVHSIPTPPTPLRPTSPGARTARALTLAADGVC